MAAKFHVNGEGNPGPCSAQAGNCPFGGPDAHYESQTDARAAYEMSQASNMFTKVDSQSYFTVKERSTTSDMTGSWGHFVTAEAAAEALAMEPKVEGLVREVVLRRRTVKTVTADEETVVPVELTGEVLNTPFSRDVNNRINNLPPGDYARFDFNDAIHELNRAERIEDETAPGPEKEDAKNVVHELRMNLLARDIAQLRALEFEGGQMLEAGMIRSEENRQVAERQLNNLGASTRSALVRNFNMKEEDIDKVLRYAKYTIGKGRAEAGGLAPVRKQAWTVRTAVDLEIDPHDVKRVIDAVDAVQVSSR